MKKLKSLIFNNKGKFFLLIVSVLTIFLFIKGNGFSAEYNARLQNITSVMATVTDITEKTKTEETLINGPDGVETLEEEVTYYKIETVYEYNNQKYTYSFNSDFLTSSKSGDESYYVGRELPLQIDSTSPEYVFDENPGAAYKIASYILAGFLIIVLIYCGINKFFPQRITFCLVVVPFIVGAVGFFIGGICFIKADKSNFIGYLFAFILPPIYALVAYIFYKISKSH